MIIVPLIIIANYSNDPCSEQGLNQSIIGHYSGITGGKGPLYMTEWGGSGADDKLVSNK
jgi:hypothetical protein